MSSNVKRMLVAISMALGCSSEIEAATSIRAFAGGSRFYGDLSSENNAATYSLALRHLGDPSQTLPLRLGLAFEVLQLGLQNETRTFPYENDERLRVNAFLLLPTACYEIVNTVDACGSIGLGTVNLNARHNRQDYGTWTYEVVAVARLATHWSLGLVSKYVGKVEQRSNGDESEFAFLSYGAALLYDL